jgi:hypothetical protein
MRTACCLTFVIFSCSLCFGPATFFLCEGEYFCLATCPVTKLTLFYLLQIIRGTLFCVFLFQNHHMAGLLWVTTISWNSSLLSGYFFHSTASTVPNQQSVYKYKEDRNVLQLISTLITGTKLYNANSTCGKTTSFDRNPASQTQYRKVSCTVLWAVKDYDIHTQY